MVITDINFPIDLPWFSSCCEILVCYLEAECVKVPRPHVKQEKGGIWIDYNKNYLISEAHYIKFHVRSLFESSLARRKYKMELRKEFYVEKLSQL
jgi:hypothetical protein